MGSPSQDRVQRKPTIGKHGATEHKGHRARVRERFTKAGLNALHDYEQVELLLTLAIPRKDVKPIAKALIERYGDLKTILDAPLHDLTAVPGIGNVAPVALKIVREIAAMYLQQAAGQKRAPYEPLELEKALQVRLGSLREEVFEIVCMDKGHRILPNGIVRIEDGTIDRANVYPRSVVKAALKMEAACIVLVHNHPSGSVEPSVYDKALTKAVLLAAEAVDIKVLDHLIISATAAFSFKREGLLS